MLFLTPDGKQNGTSSWVGDIDPCCVPVHCYDDCRVACNMVSSLPSGPLWDQQKDAAIKRVMQINTAPFDLCSPLVPCDGGNCLGMADYALYLSGILGEIINKTIWQTFRESNPFTATETHHLWMDRLGWQDCFQNTCRRSHTGEISAAEIQGDCGPIYCPPVLPDDLRCAIDHGIVRSLSRLRMGIINNLASINWAIEPLGATLHPFIPEVDEFGDPCTTDDCCDIAFELCPTDGMINACPEHNCGEARARPKIPACVDQSCTKQPGQPDIYWPNLIAAECIVRTFLDPCPDNLRLCTDPRFNSCVTPGLPFPDAPPPPEFDECFIDEEAYDPQKVCGNP